MPKGVKRVLSAEDMAEIERLMRAGVTDHAIRHRFGICKRVKRIRAELGLGDVPRKADRGCERRALIEAAARAWHESPTEGQEAIARRFGVGKSSISRTAKELGLEKADAVRPHRIGDPERNRRVDELQKELDRQMRERTERQVAAYNRQRDRSARWW